MKLSTDNANMLKPTVWKYAPSHVQPSQYAALLLNFSKGVLKFTAASAKGPTRKPKYLLQPNSIDMLLQLPLWISLRAVCISVLYKGVNIVFKDIDCDQDAATADKFKVTGYPSIKLVYDNKIYDYDAKPNKDTLIQFLNSVL